MKTSRSIVVIALYVIITTVDFLAIAFGIREHSDQTLNAIISFIGAWCAECDKRVIK